ncbi:MAG: NifB/NifX family molybdenum-iron cluster-binding protein [Paludibacteraceae bacterium]|jgi:predicted Fe-Mo cluster-binding NifX family protein|nr:NifB/NifX family molybdenum-iron cluster-binding protein [Paludibacteraceae bacterium]OQC34338.1 MAG: Dinitrogenase iron-molybdenum cofactor [Bacteroidetes bacterium ADurb.Bin057]HHT60789.1 dinitrogenase iron-molybdenum cofactor biosynthesis protein [Bacteroidales bacterium]MBP9040005.1 NifB/NifX family molybdenum-iron cluster-binding protein [Paludibacteraceae bacterium]HOG36395.1 NifB/NifX family molybdenum-iron cluster-binding protein [Paludibacteraceae bacterium]
MKIAITSERNSLESKMDTRFGRCAFFAIYDTETQTTDFIPNPAKDSSEGAGPKAVEFIASKGVSKVVASEFGGKAKSLLDKLQIEMLHEKDKSIAEVIQQF